MPPSPASSAGADSVGEGAAPVGATAAGELAAGEVAAGELADADASGDAPDPSATVKVNWSETGCPSLETTRHTTVTRPGAADAASGWVTFVPSSTGSPPVMSAPEASVTTICVVPAPSMSTPLKVRVISAGRASTSLPAAGDEPISSSCAKAGEATSVSAKPTMRARRAVAAENGRGV